MLPTLKLLGLSQWTCRTSQATVIQVPVTVEMAPGWGVQVVPMAPISLEHMRDAVNVDGFNHR